MRDEDILDSVREAVEFDRLKADLTGRQPRLDSSKVPRPVSVRWVALSAALAAAAAIVFLALPQSLTVVDFSVTRAVTRSDRAELEIALGVNRPAYVRLILIDERLERWIIPLDETGSKYTIQLDGTRRIQCAAYPQPDDPRGDARATYAMVVVSRGQEPSVDRLLKVITDPVAPATLNDDAVRLALERIVGDLTDTFGCVVRLAEIP